MTASQLSSPSTLSLVDIAAWQFKYLAQDKPQIIAGIPSLQRGAVWKAGQVELLWDSILRGFPVGALVVCRKLDGQGTRSGKYTGANGSGWSPADVLYHLLDGQQRCNAIALGFVNALEPSAGGGPPTATLWIDLTPKALAGTTRQFLLRMLTEAHPWGYSAEDDTGYLGIGAIRDAVAGGQAPSVISSIPHASRTPIPFSWLTEAALCRTVKGPSLWLEMVAKCRAFKGRGWADNAADLISAHLDQSAIQPHLDRIEAGLQKAAHFRIVALEVPQGALDEPSLQEEAGDVDDSAGGNRIYNVEHLFQRLNGAGTELRGEELLFSMVKAYWPTIELSFDAIKDGYGYRYLPMPGSRLAMLGARAALIGADGKGSFPSGFTINRIRALALASTDKAREERARLENYFGLTHINSDLDPQDSDLHQNLKQIDEWLLFNDSIDNDWGIPAVLRSSLAQDAPDVFLLLLHLAQRVRVEGLTKEEIAAIRKPVLGLATALYWFGQDRAGAVAMLLPHLDKSRLSVESFSGLLKHCLEAQNGDSSLLKIFSLQEMDALIPKPSEADDKLSEWTFWRRVIESESDETVRDAKMNNEWPSMWRVVAGRGMLLYAQRTLLNKQFRKFDPSRVDIREGKNRPWDYDHLLTAETLRRNQGGFRNACREWGGTIGNFRAWPLEKNRSRHDALAKHSINTPDDRLLSLVADETECDAFSLGWDEINDRVKAARFMNAARSRILRIYADWFCSLEIHKLLRDAVIAS